MRRSSPAREGLAAPACYAPGVFSGEVPMRALIDRYIDAYNRLDVDGMLATLHPQVTF